MDKEYFQKYYQEHAEEKKRKRKERYAMTKATKSAFTETDKEIDKTSDKLRLHKAKILARKLAKDKLYSDSENLAVMVNDWDCFCKNIMIPACAVDNKTEWIAVFNNHLTEVCFIKYEKIKPHFYGKVKDLYDSHYEVPVNEWRWFDCSE
jgi:hypothetical protein